VKNIEIEIFDPRAIEVRGGICTCMKGNGVLGVTLLTNSYKVSVNPNLSKCDVSRYFVLPVLIEEYKGVLSRITAIVLAPPKSWVIGVVYLYAKLGHIGDGTGRGRKGNGGVIRGKPN